MSEVKESEYLELEGEKLSGRDQCLAFALFTQAKYAGFPKPDIRIWNCPHCGGDGFNTGMGVISFECGAGIGGGDQPEFFEPCTQGKQP